MENLESTNNYVASGVTCENSNVKESQKEFIIFKKRKAEEQLSKKEKRRLKSQNRVNHCIEYLPSKGRQCRQDRIKNSEYCMNHYLERKHAGTLSESELNLCVQEDVKQLINCPICNIAIKQSKYKFHIENCPKVKRLRHTQSQPYYVKNINGNVPKEMKALKDIKSEFSSKEEFLQFANLVKRTFDKAIEQANKTWNTPKEIYNIENRKRKLTLEELKNTKLSEGDYKSTETTGDLREQEHITAENRKDPQSEHAVKCYRQIYFPVHIERPSYLEDELSREDQVTKNKHVFQQASIVGLVDKHNLINHDTVIIDMGSGKAELSYTFAQALKRKNALTLSGGNEREVRFILVDRGVFRRRKDNAIRMEHPLINKENVHLEQESIVKRLSIDIQDLDMGRVDELKSKNAVCISKHLCGVATDLSLRCLEQTNRRPIDSEPNKSIDNLVSIDKMDKGTTDCHFNLGGYFICLCCHHICHWKEYINQKFWTDTLQLTEEDFTKVKAVSSWAVSEFREESHHDDIFGALTNEEKMELGWKCKRLIDFGRIDYLCQKNYDAYLLQYIDESISPECLIMVAIPRH